MTRWFSLLPLLAPFAASADDAILTWENATQFADGSPLPASGEGSLVSTTVEYGTCQSPSVFGTKQGEMTVAAPATQMTVALVVVQEFCFRAFHVSTYNLQSGFSNVVARAVATDTDGDGMPDDYELQNGFDPLNAADASADADGDGLSNLKEFQRGTNPHDRNDPRRAPIAVLLLLDEDSP